MKVRKSDSTLVAIDIHFYDLQKVILSTIFLHLEILRI